MYPISVPHGAEKEVTRASNTPEGAASPKNHSSFHIARLEDAESEERRDGEICGPLAKKTKAASPG
jgi:hypothetical protein